MGALRISSHRAGNRRNSVRERNRRQGRRAVGLAGDGCEAAHRLCERPEAGSVAVRARLAETRGAKQDQAGVVLGEPLVAEIPALERAWSKALEHDVARCGKLREDVLRI